jgi:hypothetical protein
MCRSFTCSWSVILVLAIVGCSGGTSTGPAATTTTVQVVDVAPSTVGALDVYLSRSRGSTLGTQAATGVGYLTTTRVAAPSGAGFVQLNVVSVLAVPPTIQSAATVLFIVSDK